MKHLPYALALVMTYCMASVALAHSLRTHTARITLRDAHVEVSLQLDLLGFLAQLDERDSVANQQDSESPPAKASQLLSAGRRALETEALLLMDGRRIPLTLRRFPDVNQLAQLLMSHHGSVQGHDGSPILVPVILEAKLVGPAPQTLALQLPHDLDSVLITLVQPQTQLSSPGARVSFAVLQPGRTAHSDNRGFVLSGAAALGLTLFWVGRATRRRPPQSSGTASVV